MNPESQITPICRLEKLKISCRWARSRRNIGRRRFKCLRWKRQGLRNKHSFCKKKKTKKMFNGRIELPKCRMSTPKLYKIWILSMDLTSNRLKRMRNWKSSLKLCNSNIQKWCLGLNQLKQDWIHLKELKNLRKSNDKVIPRR